MSHLFIDEVADRICGRIRQRAWEFGVDMVNNHKIDETLRVIRAMVCVVLNQKMAVNTAGRIRTICEELFDELGITVPQPEKRSYYVILLSYLVRHAVYQRSTEATGAAA